jgi:hypothetical protein
MTVLLFDEFNAISPDVNRTVWTTPTGDSAFFGRTAIRNPASTNDGSGTTQVSGGVAHLLLATYNPTALAPGDSFWGSEIDSVQTFGLGGTIVGLQFEARVRSPAEIPPGVVTSLFGFNSTSSTLHDEIDWEFASNLYQQGASPPYALINRYANEPLGSGHPAELALPNAFDFTAFHTYTIRYFQGRIVWLIDGSVAHEETTYVPTGPLSVRLNAWAPATDFALAYNAALQPTASPAANVNYDYQVDWIRVASTTTKFFDDSQSFAAVAEILPGVTEPTIPIYFNGVLISGMQHHAVELFDKTADGSGFPGTFVDLAANTVVRVTYQKPLGEAGSYGTSFYGTFSYRPAEPDQLLKLVPTVDRADVTIGGSARYTDIVAGHFGSAADITSTRTFADPTFDFTAAGVTDVFAVNQHVELATGSVRAVGDVLRAGTISSMFATSQQFDASLILWEDPSGNVHSFQLSDTTPRDSHLFDAPQELGSWIELVKGAGSTWHPSSPTIRVVIRDAQGLQLGLQGFLDASQDQNDDSLSVWPEVINAPGALDQNVSYTVDFDVIAVAPLTDNTTYVTPFSAKLAGTPYSNATLSGSGNTDATGSDSDNVLTGNNGNNTLAGRAGSDTLNGGAGTDTAVVRGLVSQYTLSSQGASYALSGPDGNDTLTSIEYLRFGTDIGQDWAITNVSLGDVGNGSADRLTEQITDLYVAYFNRAPDSGGLAYWFKTIYTGEYSLRTIAERFTFEQEYLQAYPSSLANRNFVEQIYLNLFDRNPDTGGWDWWTNELDTGHRQRSGFILDVIEGAYADTSGPEDRTLIDNKHDLSLYYSGRLSLQPEEGYDDAIVTLLNRVTGDVNTVAASVRLIDYAFDTPSTLSEIVNNPPLGVIEPQIVGNAALFDSLRAG